LDPDLADLSRSIVSLVLGAQPGKVYNNLRIIASRMKERF
jgi:RNA-binding protein PNO1